MEHLVEHKAANILLSKGVKVQVATPFFIRIFGIKSIKLMLLAPSIYILTKIAGKYLELNIGNTKDLSVPEAFTLLKNHAKAMTEIITIAILGKRQKMWMVKPLRYMLENSLSEKELCYLFQLIIVYGGIEDFINTIRLTEATRITKPMNLSQEEKTG